jgi:hypothetical protein
VTTPTIDRHAQRRTKILTHSSSTITLKHPSALHTRYADLQAAVLQEEAVQPWREESHGEKKKSHFQSKDGMDVLGEEREPKGD